VISINNDVKKFLEATKQKNMKPTPRQEGKPAPPLEKKAEGERFTLPEGGLLMSDPHPLNQAIAERVSHRRYSDTPLELKELAYLLHVTQGVKKTTPKATFRNVPSAGARHAFLTYLHVRNVVGLKPGIYRYHALDHELVLLNEGEKSGASLKEACYGQTMFDQHAVSFIWVADVERMYHVYGERGYRYLFLDAGHVCQNLYLACETIDSGTVAVAAYDDDKLNSLLKLDGDDFFAIYVAPVGKL